MDIYIYTAELYMQVLTHEGIVTAEDCTELVMRVLPETDWTQVYT
jgi:hypothetical protein